MLAVTGPVLTLSGTAMTAAGSLDPNPVAGKTLISTCEFSITASYGTTVEQFTGLKINHVVLVSFSNFPNLIDAMGGITYDGSCVVSRISGGSRNGREPRPISRCGHKPSRGN